MLSTPRSAPLTSLTSTAKPILKREFDIAALKRLRHPKSDREHCQTQGFHLLLLRGRAPVGMAELEWDRRAVSARLRGRFRRVRRFFSFCPGGKRRSLFVREVLPWELHTKCYEAPHRRR